MRNGGDSYRNESQEVNGVGPFPFGFALLLDIRLRKSTAMSDAKFPTSAPSRRIRKKRTFRKAMLRIALHLDALRLSVRAYSKASWWYVIGKRLRARLTLAPILGQSSFAYPVWLLDEPVPKPSDVTVRDIKIISIIIGKTSHGRTLASLAREDIDVVVVDRDSPNPLADLWADEKDIWILILQSGDMLSPGAGKAYRDAAATASETTQIIYSDDDLLTKRGKRRLPHLKPQWNAELYKHFDFLTGAAIFRLSKVETMNFDTRKIGGFVRGALKRAMLSADGVMHLPYVLHHRQKRSAPQPPQPFSISRLSNDTLPSVSVIVPTRNRMDLVQNCLEGLARTEYPSPMQIVVIDNGSNDPATLKYLDGLDSNFARVLRDDGPFNFAAINNRAVEQTEGGLLCFLNNDIEVLGPEWLAAMANQATRTDVGAVGAQLRYPDGRIQHAGVVLGIGGGAAHAHRLVQAQEVGYFHRHSLPQFVSAVTAACMVVEREKFLTVGGFDAESFAVSFNDVDLCMKLNAQGWQSLYEPRAALVHHESVSRGLDRHPVGAARLAGELASLQNRWGIAPATGPQRAVDPYHHPALSPFSERFVLGV